MFGSSPETTAQQIITSLRAKADQNERRSRVCSVAVVLATTLVPVSLVLSSEWLPFAFGKALPAVLAAAAAGLSTWLRAERPHERWVLYRGYQRAVEMEVLRFENQVGQYGGADAAQRLIDTLADMQLSLHDTWAGLVPRSAEVASRSHSD